MRIVNTSIVVLSSCLAACAVLGGAAARLASAEFPFEDDDAGGDSACRLGQLLHGFAA